MSSSTISPQTPTSKSRALDKKVLQFDRIWQLGIQPRGINWSPSKGGKSDADEGFEKIKYLYWNAEEQLDNLLFTGFPRQAYHLVASEQLSLLLGLLRDLFLQIQNLKGERTAINRPFTPKPPIHEVVRPRQSKPNVDTDDDYYFTTTPESPSLAASQRHSIMQPINSEKRRTGPSDNGENRSSPKQACTAQSRARSRSPYRTLSYFQVDSLRAGRAAEHFKISSLPDHNLFVDETNEPPALAQMSFRTRFECAQVALASGLNVYDLVSEDILGMTTYDELWSHFENFKKVSDEKSMILPPRSSLQVWQDASGRCEFLNLKARLVFDENFKSIGPLFNLQLDPMEYETPCRFQRAFGGDRFLYLFLPDLQLPKWLHGQESYFNVRLQEWLKRVKRFLGREWEVMHVEPWKAVTKSARKARRFSYRVILFATSGYDILPKLGPCVFKCLEPSSSPEMTLDALIKWFMPLEKIGGQSFCKAFARLNLVSERFSKAQGTIVFKPSQVRRIPDIMPDGTPEVTEYNDKTFDWNEHQQHVSTTAMNDGCAKISLGACRLIWQELGFGGLIPSAFQGRRNGTKGVWIRSGSSKAKEQEHLDVWIEISKSQEKFQPHDEDVEDFFDRHRWTFEVLDFTREAKSNALNIAFIPMLQDCGVALSDIQCFIKGIMDSQRSELITAAKDPIRLRSWVHKNMSFDEGMSRHVNRQWCGGLPASHVERVIYLLEAGFIPSQLPILGEFVKKVANQYFSNAVASFQFHLPRSTMVIGIADPTNTLRPGEIHLAFSQSIVDEISDGFFPFLDGQDILVARHPSLRNSDIQKVKAHYIHQLSHLIDVVVFPSKGCVPLASKLQGGDYDGDKFWICWEPSLTRDFKNAPEPLPEKQPTPEQLGIQVDRRKLGEFLSGPDPVKTFLTESFRFRFQPNLSDDALSSTKDNHIAKILSTLKVLSLKQISTTTLSTQPRMGLPSRPGYEEAMSIGFEQAQPIKPPRPLIHILDILYFGFMEPEIRAAFRQLNEVCTPVDGNNFDEALTEPYQSELAEGDTKVREELAALTERFKSIYHRYNHTKKPYSNDFGDDKSNQVLGNWQMAVDQCFKQYTNLTPNSTDHPSIKPWMKRIGQGPSWWDSLKASALYATFAPKGTPAKFRFLWEMAGQQLAYIKVLQGGSRRHVTGLMYANMKPKKVTLLASGAETEGSVMSPSATENAIRQLTQVNEEAVAVVDEYVTALDFREFVSTTDFDDVS